MTLPRWWRERRYGLSLHVGAATVPAFAPIGSEAGDYFERLDAGEPEVAHYHRDRWSHVVDRRDFAGLLTWRRFSGERWAQLAADGAMGYVVLCAADDGALVGDTFVATMAELATAGARRDLLVAPAIDQLADGEADPAAAPTQLRRVPDEIRAHPWTLVRPLGASLVHNRVEQAEHLLSAGALLDVLTEVVAKGGNLALAVGATLDGDIPPHHDRAIVEVGAWVHAHRGAIHDSRTFTTWGDAQVRYTMSSDVDGADVVHAIDLAAGPAVTFPALGAGSWTVLRVDDSEGASIGWEQTADGLRVTRSGPSPVGLATVYDVRLVERPSAAALFDPPPPTPTALGFDLDGAEPDTVAQLAEGDLAGPLSVPAHVTVRGLGHDRTRIHGAVTLSAGARLEHVSAEAVVVTGDGAALVGCAAPAGIDVAAAGVSVRACSGAGVRARHATALTVERCVFSGVDANADVAGPTGHVDRVIIDIDGGAGHRVVGNEVAGGSIGIRLRASTTSTVDANRVVADVCAIAVEASESVAVSGNVVHGSRRAIGVSAGRDVEVIANTVSDGDSGCVVQRGATEVRVRDNRWERCRIGVLAWDVGEVAIAANDAQQLLEQDAEVIVGP